MMLLIKGIEDLQSEVLHLIGSNIDSFLLIPSTDRQMSHKITQQYFDDITMEEVGFHLLLSLSLLWVSLFLWELIKGM